MFKYLLASDDSMSPSLLPKSLLESNFSVSTTHSLSMAAVAFLSEPGGQQDKEIRVNTYK